MKLLRPLILACFILLGHFNTALTQKPPQRTPGTLGPQEIARRTVGALVSITTYLPDFKTPLGYGSGFCVGQDPLTQGYILIITNYHVLKGSAAAIVRPVPSNGSDGEPEVDVRFIDRLHDIALLSVPIKRSSVVLATRVPMVGDPVYVMGNPEGLEGSFSSGLVSALRAAPTPLIQITAPLSHGSSGCPVLNALGQVIGIAEATFSAGQNLNFAVPASLINAALAAHRADPKLADAQAMIIISQDKFPDWKLVDHFTKLDTYYAPDSVKDIGNHQRTHDVGSCAHYRSGQGRHLHEPDGL